MHVSQSVKDTAIEKISKLEKYFTKANDIQITMSHEKKTQVIEVTIPMKGMVIRAEESSESMFTAIDKVVDKLERQILKHKNKLIQKHRGHGTLQSEFMDTYDDEIDDIKIIKSDRMADKPMTIEDACMEMDMLSQKFLVFRNSSTEEVNVVYKIKEDTYGLIEP